MSAAAAFSCGDEDLDDFLRSDALHLAEQREATTYVAYFEGRIVGYVAILADALPLQTRERKRLGLVSRHRVVPALKVARLGVCTDTRQLYAGIGTLLMRFAVFIVFDVAPKHGCRLLTVDAYLGALDFYKKLGFVPNRDKSLRGRPHPSMRLDVFCSEPIPWLS